MLIPRDQSEERWFAELTGSESMVRAASALATRSWLGLAAVGGSVAVLMMQDDVSRAGWAVYGYVPR